MKSSCSMILVLLAIAVVNGSSRKVHEASRSITVPVSLGNRLSGLLAGSSGLWTSAGRKVVEGEATVLADKKRIGERTQENRQILKGCTTQEAACQKRAAICSKKCPNLAPKERQKCIAKCSKCVPNC